MENNSEEKIIEEEVIQPTPWYFYVLALLFCIVFVACITFLAWKMNNRYLAFWYILPVICFMGL